MRVLSLICAGGVTAFAASTFSSLYTPTPHGGYMFKECSHEIPSGATVERDADGATVTHTGGSYRLPLCAALRGSLPMFVASEAEWLLQTSTTNVVEKTRQLQLPADYDGWLEYANTTHFTAGGYSSFLGTFTVPTDPVVAPQVRKLSSLHLEDVSLLVELIWLIFCRFFISSPVCKTLIGFRRWTLRHPYRLILFSRSFSIQATTVITGLSSPGECFFLL